MPLSDNERDWVNSFLSDSGGGPATGVATPSGPGLSKDEEDWLKGFLGSPTQPQVQPQAPTPLQPADRGTAAPTGLSLDSPEVLDFAFEQAQRLPKAQTAKERKAILDERRRQIESGEAALPGLEPDVVPPKGPQSLNDIANEASQRFGVDPEAFKKKHGALVEAHRRAAERKTSLEAQAIKFANAGESGAMPTIDPEDREQFLRDVAAEAKQRLGVRGIDRGGAATTAERFGRGVSRVGENFQTLLHQIVGPMVAPFDTETPAEDEFKRTIQDIRRAGDPAEVDNAVGNFALGAVELVPAIGASAAATAVAGPGGAIAFWTSQIAPDEFREFRDEGFTRNESLAGAFVSAVPQAILEMVQVRRFLPKSVQTALSKAATGSFKKQLAKHAGKTFLRELGEEVAQEAIHLSTLAVFEELADNPDVDIDFTEKAGQSLDSLIDAAGVIPFLMLPGLAIGGRKAYRNDRAIKLMETALENPELFAGITEKIENDQAPSRKDIPDTPKAEDRKVIAEKAVGYVKAGATVEQAAADMDAKVEATIQGTESPTPDVTEIAKDPTGKESLQVEGDVGFTRPLDVSKPVTTPEGDPLTPEDANFVANDGNIPPPPGYSGPFNNNLGFVPMDAAVTLIKRGSTASAYLFKKLVRQGGLAGVDLHELLLKKDRRIKTTMKKLDFLLRGFRGAVKKTLGVKPTKLEIGQKALINEALAPDKEKTRKAEAGEIEYNPIDKLPIELQAPVAELRSFVDALSAELIASGMLSEELTAIVDDNMGFYMHRAYEVFTNKGWNEKVPHHVKEWARRNIKFQYTLDKSKIDDMTNEEVRYQAKNHGLIGIGSEQGSSVPIEVLQEQLKEVPPLTENQVEGILDFLLAKYAPANNSAASRLGSAKSEGKNLGILVHRKSVPDWLRALWGEFSDPEINLVTTAEKMAGLVESNRMFGMMVEAGMGKWFLRPNEAPVTDQRGAFIKQFIVPKGEPLSPLNGLYTTPELFDWFSELDASLKLPGWLSHLTKMNSLAKVSATVGSLQTQARNLQSHGPTFLINGIIPSPNELLSALKSIAEDMGRTKGSTKKSQDFLLEVIEEGVVGDSVNAGELRDVVFDALNEDLFNLLKGASGIKNIATVAKKIYAAGDDLPKLVMYMVEKRRHARRLPDWTEQEIRSIASRKTRATEYTYSTLPEMIKWIRRFPTHGPFPSFPYAVLKATYNTMKITAEELADPRLRGIGMQRVAGMTAYVILMSTVVAFFKSMSGTTDELEEALRRMIPHWMRNSKLIPTGRDDKGNYGLIDTSYTTPFAIIEKPLMALISGEDWRAGMFDALKEVLDPVIGKELFGGELIDVVADYEKEDFADFKQFIDKTKEGFNRLGGTLVPGTIKHLDRLKKGVLGEENDFGKVYDASDEAIAFSGWRVHRVNPETATGFNIREFKWRSRTAKRVILGSFRRGGVVKPSTLVEDNIRWEELNTKAIKEMHLDAKAAITTGATMDEVSAWLKSEGLGLELRHQILTGVVNEHPFLSDLAYSISEKSLDKAVDRDQQLRRFGRYVQAVGMSRGDILDLLEREYSWRNSKNGKPKTPQRSTAPKVSRGKVTPGKITSYGRRFNRLSDILDEIFKEGP